MKTRKDLERYAADPAVFRSEMLIDSAKDEPTLFNPDPWQAEELAEIDKLWMRAVCGLKDGGPNRAWIGRARGHSKTTDEALEIIWILGLTRRKIKGLVAASSREQAQILRDQVQTLVTLNDWLGPIIDVQNFVVRNRQTESQLDIISSDAASSYGEIVDFIICDELTHWKNDDLWKSVFSTANKRKNCVLIVLTNAGYKNSWQRKVHDMAKRRKNWLFIHHDRPKASWLTQEGLEEQAEGLTDKAYRRLWWNEWQMEGGDALDEKDVTTAVNELLAPMHGNEEGWTFVGGIDLSTRRHRSALVVVAASQEKQVVRLAEVRSFKRGSDGKINLVAVQNEFRHLNSKFKPAVWCYDPHQAELQAQQAQMDGIMMKDVPFTPKNLNVMASVILQLFRSRQIELYPEPDLVADILKLRIVEKAFGFKLEAPEDESGHADMAIALAVALPAAVEYASIVPLRCFVPGRHMIETLDEMQEKLHNLDKQEQDSILSKIDAALEVSNFSPLSRQRTEDHRPELVKVLEENAIQLVPQEDEAA